MGSKEMESEPGKVVTGTPSQPSDKKDPLLDNADDYIKIDRVTCIIKRDVRFRFFIASLYNLLSEFQSAGASEDRVIEP